MKTLVTAILASLFAATTATAKLVITEVMASSSRTTAKGDWWELTNTGNTTVSLDGYYWDDADVSPSYFPSGVTIATNQSIIILEDPTGADAGSWKTAWGLTSSTTVLSSVSFPTSVPGSQKFSGLSGPNGDEVNLYNPSGTLVASVSFGASIQGISKSWQRDGTPERGKDSIFGQDGAYVSTPSPADTGSPGEGKVHFQTAPVRYAMGTYSYAVQAANPSGSTPVVSAVSLPSFLTLTPGAGGAATLGSNRALVATDAGEHLITLAAASGATTTTQSFKLTVVPPSAPILLNEYNAVGATNFLNGGTAIADDDGGELSSDAHFGRVAGNGGDWVEFVITGNGQPGLTDIRGWKIEIGKNPGNGFEVKNTLILSQDPRLQAVPNGTILTFTDKTTIQGGRDSGVAIRDQRHTTGDTWTHIWIGDATLLSYTDSATNGYDITAGVVTGIAIDNDGTQFRVKNANGQIISGPTGEGVAPISGVNSKEVFELEGHPTTTVPPIVVSTATTQGYNDGAADSTFGLSNNWLDGDQPVTQSFAAYTASRCFQWAETKGLSGSSAQPSADPDDDGRSNLHEYAYGGHPGVKDAAHPTGAVANSAAFSWNYVRRNNDPSLVFGHQASLDLNSWSPVTPVSSTTAAFPGDPEFSRVTVVFSKPLPAGAKWFVRSKVE
jgi:Lamin Tail Domain